MARKMRGVTGGALPAHVQRLRESQVIPANHPLLQDPTVKVDWSAGNQEQSHIGITGRDKCWMLQFPKDGSAPTLLTAPVRRTEWSAVFKWELGTTAELSTADVGALITVMSESLREMQVSHAQRQKEGAQWDESIQQLEQLSQTFEQGIGTLTRLRGYQQFERLHQQIDNAISQLKFERPYTGPMALETTVKNAVSALTGSIDASDIHDVL
jgi:hypothetical protein